MFVPDQCDHSGGRDRSRPKDGLGDRRLGQKDQVRRKHLSQDGQKGVPLGVAVQNDPKEQFISVIVQPDREVFTDR